MTTNQQTANKVTFKKEDGSWLVFFNGEEQGEIDYSRKRNHWSFCSEPITRLNVTDAKRIVKQMLLDRAAKRAAQEVR